MATYNFTVRAIDNLGAFADQTFSMTVNNTNLERWVVVGQNGLIHSPDGTNWIYESGQSGGKVAYGNGKWVVYGGPSANAAQSGYPANLGLTIRTSADAYNWTTTPSGIPATQTTSINGTSYTVTNSGIASLKYINGYWTAYTFTAAAYSGTNWAIPEYVSTDLATWTLKSCAGLSGTANSPLYLNDFAIDPTNNITVAVLNNANASNYYQSIISRTTTAGTWNGTLTMPGQAAGINYAVQANAGTYTSGSVAYTSGLFAVCPSIGNGAQALTSIDGVGFSSRIYNTTAGNASRMFVYANGRLTTIVSAQSSTGIQPTYYSLNGGRSWTASASTPAPLETVYLNAHNCACGAGYYNGRLIFLSGGAGATAFTSTDSGSSWTTMNLGTYGMGMAVGIAVRV